MQAVNISLDLVSIGISAALLYPLVFGKGKRDSLRQFFILMCIFNIGIVLGDIPAWACEGFAKPWYPLALRIGSAFFWLFCGPMLLFFSGYLISYLKLKVQVNRGFWIAIITLVAIHVLGSFLSIWNGMFYTITPQNTYARGFLFWLSQLIPFIIYGLDIAIFIIYRRALSRKDFVVLTSYITMPILSLAIQATNFGIALLNIGVSFALLIIYINVQSEQELRVERQEKELAEARIDIMLSQIRPHFLYNTLIAIRQLCDSDPKTAKECIRQFTLFLRGNMDSLESKTPIPFEQELKHTESFMHLLKQRFGSRLQVVYDITVRDFDVPPLSLQPIAENAVQHGVLRRDEGGTVIISTAETETAYLISIADDGVGVNAAEYSKDKRTHIGISNVRARLHAMCGGTLTYASGENGVGTIVTITIPKEGGI